MASITLYRFQPSETRFDGSIWCNKLDALLTLSGAQYKIKGSLPNKTPRGKLPTIGLTGTGDEEIIPDSENAYNELVRRGVVSDLDAGLNEEQQALTVALNAVVEEISRLMAKERWVDSYYFSRDNRERGPLKSVPWPINLIVARQIWGKCMGVLAAVGHDKRTNEELNALRSKSVAAIAAFLGDKKYIHGGDKPTRIDATLFGLFSAVVSYPGVEWNPVMGAEVMKHKNIIRYVTDIRKEWFPNRKPLPAIEESA